MHKKTRKIETHIILMIVIIIAHVVGVVGVVTVLEVRVVIATIGVITVAATTVAVIVSVTVAIVIVLPPVSVLTDIVIIVPVGAGLAEGITNIIRLTRLAGVKGRAEGNLCSKGEAVDVISVLDVVALGVAIVVLDGTRLVGINVKLELCGREGFAFHATDLGVELLIVVGCLLEEDAVEIAGVSRAVRERTRDHIGTKCKVSRGFPTNMKKTYDRSRWSRSKSRQIKGSKIRAVCKKYSQLEVPSFDQSLMIEVGSHIMSDANNERPKVLKVTLIVGRVLEEFKFDHVAVVVP